MELSEFAATILYGTTLAEKLLAPEGAFSDNGRKRASIVPAAPGRPPELAFPSKARRTRQNATPTAAKLVDPRERGLALLAFANHELLALELMALALLRFPDAPLGFRLGLARAMRDEQRHLNSYLMRGAELGVFAHEAPLSRFFWDCLASAPTPLAFVCGMSLTLEQANLDFAAHFQAEFAAVGDDVTAAILAEVHRDEIRHVQHGVHWFEQWRDPEQTAFAEYERALIPPLTPARARGIGFDAKARRQAGFGEEFIAELAAFRASKGRNPRLFWLNANCEAELSGSSQQPSAAARQVSEDLASVVSFLAREEDIVWVPQRPTRPHLERLAAAGFAVPRFVDDIDELTAQRYTELHPWGGSPAALAMAAKFDVHVPSHGRAMGTFASKAWAVELAHELSPASANDTVVATDMAAVEAALARLLPSTPAVLKAPLGTAGGAMRLVTGTLAAADAAWAAQVIAVQGAIVVERWYSRMADLSVQIDTTRESDPLIDVTRFLTDPRGRYRGHYVQRAFEDLPTEALRKLYGEQGFLSELRQTARAVAKRLTEGGYRGPAGIDAFLYEDEVGNVQLRPLVEVNVRYTMGRVALAMARHVHHRQRALWVHIPAGRARRHGAPNLAALAAELEAKHPLEHQGSLIVNGVSASCDPTKAQAVLPVLFVGEACSAAQPFLFS